MRERQRITVVAQIAKQVERRISVRTIGSIGDRDKVGLCCGEVLHCVAERQRGCSSFSRERPRMRNGRAVGAVPVSSSAFTAAPTRFLLHRIPHTTENRWVCSTSSSLASSVPRTRAAIFANATSRAKSGRTVARLLVDEVGREPAVIGRTEQLRRNKARRLHRDGHESLRRSRASGSSDSSPPAVREAPNARPSVRDAAAAARRGEPPRRGPRSRTAPESSLPI